MKDTLTVLNYIILFSKILAPIIGVTIYVLITNTPDEYAVMVLGILCVIEIFVSVYHMIFNRRSSFKYALVLAFLISCTFVVPALVLTFIVYYKSNKLSYNKTPPNILHILIGFFVMDLVVYAFLVVINNIRRRQHIRQFPQ